MGKLDLCLQAHGALQACWCYVAVCWYSLGYILPETPGPLILDVRQNGAGPQRSAL